MPAKSISRVIQQGSFRHIYNSSVEERMIFNDKEDYEVFISYLKGYLSVPDHPGSTKQAFTINGHTFKGTPHQPKNYFGKIELVAYSLMSNHFHLVLRQITPGSLERFIRSLCTRYSIYFNKKYHRKGALFSGPYKSVHIEKESLELLICFLHYQAGKYCSQAEYTGTRETSWVKNTTNDLQSFSFDEKEKELLKTIAFETFDQHLEKRNLSSKTPVEAKNQEVVKKSQKSSPRIPEIFIAIGVFILLIAIGVNNINASNIEEVSVLPPSASAEVLGVIADLPLPSPIASPSPSPLPTPLASPKTLMVKIQDGASSVNIRMDPNIQSEIVGKAQDEQVFEYTTVTAGWYRVLLGDGTGYIISKYIKIQ